MCEAHHYVGDLAHNRRLDSFGNLELALWLSSCCKIAISPITHRHRNFPHSNWCNRDPRAVPIIRPHYERYLKGMETEAMTGIPEDVFRGPVPYHAFFSTAGDLFKLTHSGEYEQVSSRESVLARSCGDSPKTDRSPVGAVPRRENSMVLDWGRRFRSPFRLGWKPV